ncbi:MAG: hypothetical protein KBS98_03955 [Flavobacterium sp.]|nr:hypothetical protein [Candidatus Neoflavobacterium equi]
MKKTYQIMALILMSMMTQISTAQVGIGTVEPTAKLHIKGNYTGGSYLTTEAVTHTMVYKNYNTLTDIFLPVTSLGFNWAIVLGTPLCTNCNGLSAVITPNAALIPLVETEYVMSYDLTPKTNSIRVQFAYAAPYILGQATGRNNFVARLRNTTTNAITSVYTNVNTTQQLNINQVVSVTPNQSYKLEIVAKFGGSNNNTTIYYVDTLNVTEVTPAGTSVEYLPYALRIEDGNQAEGYFLMSDKFGNATWRPPGTTTALYRMSAEEKEEINILKEEIQALKNAVKQLQSKK